MGALLKIESLNGWSFQHIMRLYAIASRAYAVKAILFGGSFSLSSTIAEGGLDFYLALPKPVLLQCLSVSILRLSMGSCLRLAIFLLTVSPSIGMLLAFVILILAV